VRVAPKALAKREVEKLLRAAERYGSERDIAILSTLRHTYRQVGELAALRLADIAIGGAKGRGGHPVGQRGHVRGGAP
jgi:hypothetical protein